MYRDIYLEFIITKSRMSRNHTTLSITNINNLPEIVEEAVREFVETKGLENIVRDVFAELVFINVKRAADQRGKQYNRYPCSCAEDGLARLWRRCFKT